MDLIHDSKVSRYLLSIDTDSSDPARMERALREAVDATQRLMTLCKPLPPRGRRPTFFDVQFVEPSGDILHQRRFFEQAAQHAGLHTLMIDFARNLNLRARGERWDRLYDHLWHDEMHPAGCYAVVPLAFDSTRYIPALIEHLDGCEPDYESFHEKLLHLLFRHHGWGAETRRLMAVRCGRFAGQRGVGNLMLAIYWLGFREWLEANGGLEAFVAEVDRELRSTDPRDIHLEDVTNGLFVGRSGAYAAWRAREQEKLERYAGRTATGRFGYEGDDDWDSDSSVLPPPHPDYSR